MSTIKIMSRDLANKIAAGEVVEGPISVVKELVENSIDAKSTEIKIELKEAGIKEIKVTDNGIGMDREDANLSLKRHATSKLLTIDDLSRITSLGFRGEAIPSIASISDFTIKTSKGNIGTEIKVKGGELLSTENSDSRQGTIITVKNLFYNTPARYKYLKSTYIEYAKVIEYINKIALANPNIKFTLKNDEKISVQTSGRNNLLSVINDIYGLNITKKMIEINGENKDYKVSGYISHPEVNRSNRNHMTLIVNGRVVKNMSIYKEIEEGYYTYMVIGRHPIVILNIKGDSSLFDVNIHPSKLEIKFSKMEELNELIKNIIKEKLESIYLIPQVEKKEDKTNGNKYEEITLDLERELNVKEHEEAYILNNKIKDIEENKKLPELYPIGIVQGTYIICQNEKGMYIIDQHAAKERINYEKYKEEITSDRKNIISMLIPITIELPKHEYIILINNLDTLKKLNFEVEEFGANTIIIKAHPAWLLKGYEEQSIRKIIEILTEKESFDPKRFYENIAITLSCKLSIKANTNATIDEMESLINDLRKTKNPYTCPHGRPTIIEYTNYELEKLFKRSM